MAVDSKRLEEQLRQRDAEMQAHFNARLKAMEDKHNEEMAQLRASQGQPHNPAHRPSVAQPQNNLSNNELMNRLRRQGVKSYFERASRSWEQGAYDPQGQFWMQFWDFIFNFITEGLLRAGYIDPLKIAATAATEELEQHRYESTPQGGRPPALLRRPMPGGH